MPKTCSKTNCEHLFIYRLFARPRRLRFVSFNLKYLIVRYAQFTKRIDTNTAVYFSIKFYCLNMRLREKKGIAGVFADKKLNVEEKQTRRCIIKVLMKFPSHGPKTKR